MSVCSSICVGELTAWESWSLWSPLQNCLNFGLDSIIQSASYMDDVKGRVCEAMQGAVRLSWQ